MIPPDRAFEEGSAKSDNAFKIGVGVSGLVSVFITVFVIFLCAKKDSKSKRKKPSTESSQDLLGNQMPPARHGMSNVIYGVTQDGIGECLSQNETSVLHQSSPMREERKSQNSSPQSSQFPTSTQITALTNQQQALYDSPTSNKPIQTMPTEAKKNQILFGRSQPVEENHTLSSDENLASNGCIRQDSADKLYSVPKSNKLRDEKKSPLSPKLLEKPKKKRRDASDSVMGVHDELANASCNYGTSTNSYPNLIKNVDLEKDDDTHAKPSTEKTQEKNIAFSSSREGKLSESESEIDGKKFQYEFTKMTKLEGEANSLYASPKSNKSTDERKPPWSVNVGEKPKMKPLGSKQRIRMPKTASAESVQGPDMPVYKHVGNNRKEILDKFDINYVSSTAMSTSPSSVTRQRSPLQESKSGEDFFEYQFTPEFNSTDERDTPYDIPKSSRPSDHRKPFPLPKLEDGSEIMHTDGANMTMEPEMESKEPHARFNGPLNVHTTSNKGDILEQKSRLQLHLSDKINTQSVILSSSKSAELSTNRTAFNESNSDSKKYANKEANSRNILHKSFPGKQVQHGQTKLENKTKLVSTRDSTIDDDESYTGLLSNASNVNSSNLIIKDDPSMYINIPFPAEDLPPPPPPCHFSYGNVPKTMVSKQKLSVTNSVDSEPEDQPDYKNCEMFSKRNDKLKLSETNCLPATCGTHKYINISHTPSKELEEDNEYVAMNTHDNLDSQTTDNSVAKYANIQDIHVGLAPESDRDMYLPMTKHLSHSTSDTCLYQNGGNTKLKENKNMYVNSSFSIESTQKGLHDSEQDDDYSYASVDFFLKNKIAADTANKSDDCTHHGKAPKQPVRSTSFQTTTSAKEKDIKTHTSKPQKLHTKKPASKTVLAEKTSLETIPPPLNTTYK